MTPTPAPTPTVEEIARVLALHPIFAGFDARALHTVAARCRSVAFPAGEKIMQQGEHGDFALVILDGEVDVFVEIPAGLIHMATLGRDRIVGELGGIADVPRTATIMARTDVAALRVDRDNLMSLVAELPSVTIADVSGKGIPAALFMAVSRTVMRNAPAETDMAQRMRDANRLLATGNTACMFVTMFSGVLDLETGRLRYCNAGHNSPYLLRSGGGRDLLKPTGIPFGIDPDRSYTIAETVLASGDTLFMFTDGITEAFNPAGDIFGEARLETVLDREGGIGATELVQKVIGATAEFAAGAEQSDDITCLALVYRG